MLLSNSMITFHDLQLQGLSDKKRENWTYNSKVFQIKKEKIGLVIN